MAKSVRVTWISVVSKVATVESTTASTMNLPPVPCHTSWPSTLSTSPELALIWPVVTTMLVAIVKTSKSMKTKIMPMMPPMPGVFLAPLVSSLRLAVTSQPQ
jgi:hypothetical protein